MLIPNTIRVNEIVYFDNLPCRTFLIFANQIPNNTEEFSFRLAAVSCHRINYVEIKQYWLDGSSAS